MNRQNNDMVFREESRNEQDICTVEQCDKCMEKTGRCIVTGKTVAELHGAMMRSKENYWDEEDGPSTDPNEFGLDAYNL